MEIIKKKLDNNVIEIIIGAELGSADDSVAGNVELDIENQAYFVDVINSVFEDGFAFIVVNMQNIDYVDSSGLWALFEGHKKAMQKGGKLALMSPTLDVQRVLDITKMSSKINIVSNEEEAFNVLNT